MNDGNEDARVWRNQVDNKLFAIIPALAHTRARTQTHTHTHMLSLSDDELIMSVTFDFQVKLRVGSSLELCAALCDHFPLLGF